MRILLVHEYYQQRGGEDVAFETDAELLQSAGHEVACLTFDNSEIEEQASLRGRLELLKTTLWSTEACRRLDGEMRAFQPDVVHFHNTFPLVSPGAFHTARKANAGVVATLHNYRLVCANASLFRDGQVCEDCLHRPGPVQGILHRCYRQSYSQSAAVVGMLTFHRLRNTWLKDVHRLISPSAFLRSKLIEGGLPASLIAVRPNAVRDPGTVSRPASSEGFVYVGRMARNKGVEVLLEAWRNNAELPVLRMAGGGELAEHVADWAEELGHVEFLGQMGHQGVIEEMAGAKALIFPSIWYENQPMTILEAFACGVPVIASRLGAMPELVIDGQTGLTFEAGNSTELAEKVRWAAANPREMARMGNTARRFYEAHASADASIASLVGIYEGALASTRTKFTQLSPA